MKIRLILASLVCTAAVITGLQAQPKEKEPKTPLAEKMEAIDGAQRAMNRALTAGNAEEALKQATIIHDAAEASAKLEPKNANLVPAESRAKFVADYQADMKAFVEHTQKLVAALKAGNVEEAKTINETLKKAKTDGHKSYKAAPKKA